MRRGIVGGRRAAHLRHRFARDADLGMDPERPQCGIARRVTLRKRSLRPPPPGQVATLIMPWDCQWDPARETAPRRSRRRRADGRRRMRSSDAPNRSARASASRFFSAARRFAQRPEGGCAHRGEIGMSSDLRDIHRAPQRGAGIPKLDRCHISRAGDRDAEAVRYDHRRGCEKARRLFRLSRVAEPADSRGMRTRDSGRSRPTSAGRSEALAERSAPPVRRATGEDSAPERPVGKLDAMTAAPRSRR